MTRRGSGALFYCLLELVSLIDCSQLTYFQSDARPQGIPRALRFQLFAPTTPPPTATPTGTSFVVVTATSGELLHG